MGTGKWIFRVICLVCAAALLAVEWAWLPPRREPVTAAQREEQKRSGAFQGTVQVWYISQWRTGGVSGSSLLGEVLTQMEGIYGGVFFNLQTMTPDEAQKRMLQGEAPDVAVFPGGMALPVDLSWQQLSAPDLLACYRAYVGEQSAFLPWMAMDAQVMIRDSSLNAQKLSAPGNDWTGEELAALARALTYQTKGRSPKTIYGILTAQGRWPGLGALGIETQSVMPGEFTERQAWDQLVEGNIGMLLTGPWEQMTLNWRTQQQRGPQVTVLPWPEDLPLLRSVQWIGAKASGDARKDAITAQVVRRLLAETTQKKVASAAGCQPVIPLPAEDLGALQMPAESRSVAYALPDALPDWSRPLTGEAVAGAYQGIFLWKP